MPFNLHGKHRDRHGFRHPGEVDKSLEVSQSDELPNGVFLAQKDRKQVLDMMKGHENQLASLETSIKSMEKPFVFLQVKRSAESK